MRASVVMRASVMLRASTLLVGALAAGCAHDVEFKSLAPGVWLHVTADRDIPANGLLVEGTSSSILVDSGWNDAHAKRLFDFAARRHKPVSDVIVTHSHGDRIGGAAYALGRGARVHASPQTIAHAESNHLPVPNAPLSSPATITASGATVETFFPGRGHSDDNIVVWVPAARILFGGCFLKSNVATDLGNVADADIGAWPASLAAVRARYPNPAIVVPGHGFPGGDPIAHTESLLH
jgi:metallo-beta-lactamase class B